MPLSSVRLAVSFFVLVGAPLLSLAMSGPATDEVKLPANRDFEITLNDGRVITGTSTAEGLTELLASEAMQMARIRILDQAR